MNPDLFRSCKLAVPWVSQMDNKLPNDCGHACDLMLLKYAGLGEGLTVEDLFYCGVGNPGYTTQEHLVDIAAHYGLECERLRDFQLIELPYYLVNARPVIVLVDYAHLPFPPHLRTRDQGSHWIVIVGFDSEYFYAHDPLWLPDQLGGDYGAGGRRHPIHASCLYSAMDATRLRLGVVPAQGAIEKDQRPREGQEDQ